MLIRVAVVPIALSLVACSYTPPVPPQPRAGTPVHASFGQTWDATIDVLAESNLRVETLDRSSGLIIPANWVPTRNDTTALRYADCGRRRFFGPYLPTSGRFNVVVRGDSASSSVRVNGFFFAGGKADGRGASECTSRIRWEAAIEQLVKERAEGRATVALAGEESPTTERVTVANTGPIRGVVAGAEVRLRAPRIASVPIQGWVRGWRTDTLYVSQDKDAPADILVPLRWIERLELVERTPAGVPRFRTVLGGGGR